MSSHASPPSAEFIEGPMTHITTMLRAMQGGQPVDNVLYPNILLSGDGVTDVHDPACGLSVDSANFYFPGADPRTGKRYEAFSFTDDAIDIAAHRRLILGLEVGQQALQRINPQVVAARAGFERLVDGTGTNGVLETKEMCQRHSLPLSVVQFGTVEKSDLMPIGARTAVLYHPLTIHPKPALRHLQRRLQAVMAEEQL